jgi:hypothetical protein
MTSTRSAHVQLHDDWCVVTRIQAETTHTLEDARENLAATIATCGGVRRPLVVDISRCSPLEPEVRHAYADAQLVESFLALAVIVEASPFGRVMGDIYLRVARPGIPTRVFQDEAAAHAWLRTFVS